MRLSSLIPLRLGDLCDITGLNCSVLSSHFSEAASSFIQLTLELKAMFCSGPRYVWPVQNVARGLASIFVDWTNKFLAGCVLGMGPWWG